MIKILSLIFDFGGVLCKPQNKSFLDNVYQILNQVPPCFFKVYRSYRGNFDNGRNTGEEYWSNILRHLGIPVNKSIIHELIKEDIESWTENDPEIIQFITNKRKKVQNLSIISNMPIDILEYIRNHFQWLDLFDEQTYSCEIGVNKPAPGIYEHCLDRIRIQPHECLFVDDSMANVEGAKRTGMNAIHYRTYSQFVNELENNYRLNEI
jgi:putative hydrolase of the HAD superfamily